MRTLKTLMTALVALAVMAGLSACSTASLEPDEFGLHYEDGAFSSKKFENCIEPSDRVYDGPGDKHYLYYYGQRTFSFTGASGSEQSPLPVTTKDGQEVLIPGFVTFTLNTDCEVLQEFHERIGIKYAAYKDGGGWGTFLSDYLAVPLSAVMNEASLKVNWRELYASDEARNAFTEYVKDNLPTEIRTTLGGDYIEVNAVSIAKPVVSEKLTEALAAVEEAKLADSAQKQKNEVARTKYQSLSDCRTSGLSEQACLTIYLAETGSIPFYPVPQGSALNVTPPSGAQNSP